MNKRIKELIIEAGYDIPEADNRAFRLSELIVNECIKECRTYSATILRFSQFGSNAATECAKILKEKLRD